MAITQTLVDNGGQGNPRIYKFAGVDCIAGVTTAVIDTAGYNYAIVYATEATDTAAAGTGALSARAVIADNESASAPFIPVDTAIDGDLDAELTVMKTLSTALIGSHIRYLPRKMVLVHDGGNTGTAFTIDVYLELHE